MDGGLVEDEERRGLRHREGDQDELSLAEGELAGVASPQSVDADPRDRGVHRRRVDGARTPERVLVGEAAEGDDLLDPRRERDGGLAGNGRQAAGDRGPVEARDGIAAERRPAAAGHDQPGKDAQEGRLSRPRSGRRGDPFAGGDGDVDAAQDDPVAVRGDDALEGGDGGRGRPRGSGGLPPEPGHRPVETRCRAAVTARSRRAPSAAGRGRTGRR